MYEELIKALRTTVTLYEAVGQEDLVTIQLMNKAADTIEELMRRCEQFQYMPLPAWFPVTEEPPLSVGNDGYNGYLVYTNGYYAVADYTTDKLDDIPSFHVNGEYEPDVTHYMPLPKPPKEEK